MDSLLPVDSLVDGLPALELEPGAVTRILQGQGAQIDIRDDISGLVRLYGPERRFLGLGELDTSGRLLPKRLVATSHSAASAGSAPSTTS
jgi:tRNA pseudouridine55 synthase